MSARTRRPWAAAGVILVVGLVVALAILLWPVAAPRALPTRPASPALVERGRYVATAADCVACHTVEGGAPYAGGRAFRLPFGTLYAPNITPDRETGIGAWSDGEFLRAVHKGIGRRGEELYPAFPYTSYARMTDDDVLAVKAYLFSLPPVRGRAPENGLTFPFNQRPIMRFWKLLFMPRGAPQNDPKRSAEVNRGAYLVETLGHCSECHTPRNLLFAPKAGQALSGETMQGWTAWNITPDPRHGVGAWSVEDLTRYFATGYAPGRGIASGPMKEAVDYSLSKLSPQDLRAMAVYLKSVDAKGRGPVPDPQAPEMIASTPMAPAGSRGQGLGKQVFEGACASCHAWNGTGQQTSATALRGLRSVSDPKGRNVVQTVLRGGQVVTPDGRATMPAFARAYSNAEIAAVSNYVIQHFGGRRGEVTAGQVASARKD